MAQEVERTSGRVGFFGQPTMASALGGIQDWDRRAGSLPLLSEQLLLMKDGPRTWSSTHAWPAVRREMLSLGLVRELEPTRFNGWVVHTTEITELGREIRAAIAKATNPTA